MEIMENKSQWIEQYQNRWLAHYRQTGEIKWDLYSRVINTEPVPGKAVDLSHSRLLLISSAGGYLKNSQTPYDAANPLGDYSTRTFPITTDFAEIAYAHEHYDHTAVDADPQVLLPLHHLEAFTAEGLIGSLAPQVVSFMGYQPDAARVVDEVVPIVLEMASEQNAQAALLVPS